MVLWEALDALSHQLELCRIGPESRVVLLITGRPDGSRVSLLRAAVARGGSPAIEVRPIEAHGHRSDPTLLAGALEQADVVVAVGSADEPGGIGSATPPGAPEWVDSIGEHTKVLHLLDVEPHEFPPHANLRRRAVSLRQTIDDASALTLTDDHGSDLVVELGGADTASGHGLLDDDHATAHFPSGWVSVVPASGSVNGTLVVMPGDSNLGAGRAIASPVVLELANDHVTAISGDSPDADVLRALFEYPDDPSAYGIAEFALGLNPAGRAVEPFDPRLLDRHVSRLLAGVATVSFGENLTADRPCGRRFTLALAARDVFVDDLPVARRGRLEGDFAPDVYER